MQGKPFSSLRYRTLVFVAGLILLFQTGCSRQAPLAFVLPTTTPAGSEELIVFAAASLTESYSELGTLFETQHPNVKIIFNFAGSQQLAQQIDQGAAVDVYASASNKYMEAAIESGRVLQADAVPFARNRLMVIFPKDNPAGLKELRDLSNAGLKLVLADESVPVGQYSLNFLDKAVRDPCFGKTYKVGVLKNVVSYENNVKSVTAKVALGEADAGIVYVTDITAKVSENLGTLDIPDALNTVAVYPIAPIADSQNPELARAFFDLVRSPAGQEVLARYGFLMP
jgi:molybdate transport system substrate-binding protein